MHATASHLPSRSPAFRWLTILSAGLGSFVIGFWGLNFIFAEGLASPIGQTLGVVIAALCALAASGTALAFFAGVDESAEYVFRETHFDKLTGLFNRPAMVGRLAEAVMSASFSGKPAFLVDIDIDRFKQINDGIGYGAGDELIKALAERLNTRLRMKFGGRGVEVGRIGAGEFAAILPDRPGLDMEALIEDLIADLKRPYQLSTHLQAVNLSVGIVASPKDGTDPTLLLRRSNLALQHARATGSGGWTAFSPAMGQAADRRQWIESELQSAFERGDFDLHYQPQFDLATGETVGYEALIRWVHPERGPISPAEFIPVAEETGMVVPLGQWVLRKACRDAHFLPEGCVVAVNISAVQFSVRDFLGSVRDALRESRLPASRLELEITETAMTQDRDRAAQILRGLAGMGISVAVDDFGTGYSNLSSLIDFPFTKLKIDRSFVSRLETDANSGAVVSTIVGLSRALGVRTIAEGVETPEQATLLRAAGCETVQGFLYGRPAPLVRAPEEPRRRVALH